MAGKTGNPATAATAKREAAAQAALNKAEQAAAAARIQEQFKALVLPEAVLDDDGYEIIPDKSALAGGSYKFKVKGQGFTLPNLQYLPMGIAQQLHTMNEAQAQSVIFGRYCPDLLGMASADELMHVMKRWQDHSKGLGLGE